MTEHECNYCGHPEPYHASTFDRPRVSDRTASAGSVATHEMLQAAMEKAMAWLNASVFLVRWNVWLGFRCQGVSYVLICVAWKMMSESLKRKNQTASLVVKEPFITTTPEAYVFCGTLLRGRLGKWEHLQPEEPDELTKSPTTMLSGETQLKKEMT